MIVRDIDPEKDQIVPKCPHCLKKIHEVYRLVGKSEKQSWLHGSFKGLCYVCPHCEVILGFAHVNGGA